MKVVKTYENWFQEILNAALFPWILLGWLFFWAITVKSKSIVPAVIYMSINDIMVLSGMILK
jgi:hypothetical protein